jgi:hypothetical protein
MVGHERAGVAHDDATGEHDHLDGLADQTPGHGVAVGVEVDRAIRAGPYGQDRAAGRMAQGHCVDEVHRPLGQAPVAASDVTLGSSE